MRKRERKRERDKKTDSHSEKRKEREEINLQSLTRPLFRIKKGFLTSI
jgi:hypothetical protein